MAEEPVGPSSFKKLQIHDSPLLQCVHEYVCVFEVSWCKLWMH
jgi:hypothetical protein